MGCKGSRVRIPPRRPFLPEAWCRKTSGFFASSPCFFQKILVNQGFARIATNLAEVSVQGRKRPQVVLSGLRYATKLRQKSVASSLGRDVLPHPTYHRSSTSCVRLTASPQPARIPETTQNFLIAIRGTRVRDTERNPPVVTIFARLLHKRSARPFSPGDSNTPTLPAGRPLLTSSSRCLRPQDDSSPSLLPCPTAALAHKGVLLRSSRCSVVTYLAWLREKAACVADNHCLQAKLASKQPTFTNHRLPSASYQVAHSSRNPAPYARTETPMIELEFLIEDKDLIALATAYWALDETGGWLHKKTSSLEAMFSLPSGRLQQQVGKVCVARSLVPYCTECSAKAVFKSRTDADSHKRLMRSNSSTRLLSADLCKDCHSRKIAEGQAIRQTLLHEQLNAMRFRLGEMVRNLPAKDYHSVGLRESFLLLGLLGYSGESWRGENLSSWESHRTRLCGEEKDSLCVYDELYTSGWLCPSPDSLMDAFCIDEDARLTWDTGRVCWVLASDQSGEPFEMLMTAADHRLRIAEAGELISLWKWVCLRELHSHFNFYHRQFRFRSRGWTPTIETNLARLLEDCSLAVAKTVVYKCFKHLAAELQKGKLTAAHIYNMLPGSFQRTHDHWVANGWPIRPWERRLSVEPVYTGLLFDRVLGGGDHFYGDLTGSGFIG